jgi:uridine kinase
MTAAALVVIRGNSGSGKTTAAREARRRFGRGAGLVELSHGPLCVRDV